MNSDDFLRCSFIATVAFGLLSLFGLLAAALVLGDRQAAALVLLSCALAYVAQGAFTRSWRTGKAIQTAALLAWGAAFASLFFL